MTPEASGKRRLPGLLCSRMLCSRRLGASEPPRPDSLNDWARSLLGNLGGVYPKPLVALRLDDRGARYDLEVELLDYGVVDEKPQLVARGG